MRFAFVSTYWSSGRMPTRTSISSCIAPLSLSVAVLCCAPIFASPQSSSSPPSAQDVQALLERVSQLEQSNSTLQNQVAELKSAPGEQWLTEQRASEIRAIVADVLADSSTRNTLQDGGLTAGWDNGFFLKSPDSRFTLNVGGMIQARWMGSYISGSGSNRSGITEPTVWALDNAQKVYGFDASQTQLWVQGNLFGPDLEYKIKGNFASTDEYGISGAPFLNTGPSSGDFMLLDAYVRWHLMDEWSLRVGQFKLPFMRETLVEDQNQLVLERSAISEHLGVGRSQGIELTYMDADFRWSLAFSDGGEDNVAGQMQFFGSQPLNSPWDQISTDYAFTSRAEWKFAGGWNQFTHMTSPIGDEYALLGGVGTHYQQGDPDTGTESNSGDANTWFALTGDVSAMYGGATLFGSFTYVYGSSPSATIMNSANLGTPTPFDLGRSDSWGTVIQASYYIDPKWELYTRWEYGLTSVEDPSAIPGQYQNQILKSNHLSLITTGANWYLDGEDVKVSFDFGITTTATDANWYTPNAALRASDQQDEMIFRTQLQLVF